MSSTTVRYTPLYGARSQGPICALLEVDDCRILLDCGWNMDFDTALLEPMLQILPTVDCVLISQPSLAYLGALPYARKHGLRKEVPVFGTIPVYNMGLMFLYDAYLSLHATEDFNRFTLDDVDQAFENMLQVKYLQRMPLAGRGAGIDVVAHNAGHLVGAAVWRITKDTEEIVYAIDYNHKKERHLSALNVEQLGRPSLLITDAYNYLREPSRRGRDRELLDHVMATLRRGGNVLIPVDTAGRVLELLPMLDEHWTTHRLGNYGLAFLAPCSYNVVQFAKSQLEWLSDTMSRAFEMNRVSPFQFHHARLHAHRKELGALPRPMVILASQPSLRAGAAKELLLEWASDPLNSIVFVDRSDADSLASTILSAVSEATAAGRSNTTVSVRVSRRVALEGDELFKHLQTRREEEERLARERLLESREADVKELDEGETDDDDDMDDGEPLGHVPALFAGSDSYDASAVDFVKAGLKYPLFPFVDKPFLFDEYGEIVDAKEYPASNIPEDLLPSDNLSILQQAQAEPDGATVRKEDVPTKCVEGDVPLTLHCAAVRYWDFEGRSDGKSMRNIVAEVAPRKLIVVHGNDESCAAMKLYCETHLKGIITSVYAPTAMQSVDASSNTNIFPILIRDSLMESLPLSIKVGEHELTHIDGEIARDHKSSLGGMVLLPVPPTRTIVRNHKPVLVGELRLADFRALLLQNGFKVELQGGVLMCNERVAVRKVAHFEGSSELLLDGIVCDDYFAIRELLYSQLHRL